MSKTWYGSIDNRIEEGKQFVEEIKVGTGMTEYMWSDRHAYEVVKVDTQDHVWVRRYDYKRIDDYGMSDWQEYEYISNPENPVIELVKRKNGWNKLYTCKYDEMFKIAAEKVKTGKSCANTDYSIEKQIDIELNFMLFNINLTDSQRKRFFDGKEVKRYIKWNNISFGKAEEYFDFSF